MLDISLTTTQNPSLSKGDNFTQGIQNLKTQFKYLTDYIKNVFPERDNADLETIKEKIASLLKISKQEEKINYLEQLQKHQNDCFEKFMVLKSFNSEPEKSQLKTLEVFTTWFPDKTYSFPNKINLTTENLLHYISEKLSSLHEKTREKIFNENENSVKQTLKLLTFRLKKILPGRAILNELKRSIEKDEKRTEKFNNLRHEWFKFLIFYRTFEGEVKIARIEKTVIPKLKEFNEELIRYKEELDNFKMEDLRARKLYFSLEKDNDYESKVEIATENFKKSFSNFFENVKKIKNFLESRNTFIETTQKSMLDEIDNEMFAIVERSKRKYCFLDLDMKKRFAQINKNLSENYFDTRNKIMELNRNFFKELKETNEKLNKCLENPYGLKQFCLVSLCQ